MWIMLPMFVLAIHANTARNLDLDVAEAWI